MFTPLNLPKAPLKLFKKNNQVFVLDAFRNKEILLTPEEWVRQHFLHYITLHKNIPKGLIISEHGLTINEMTRRCDAVVFTKNRIPLAIIECKAPEVKLSEKTMHQIAQYNFALHVNWLILTNGIETVVCFVNAKEKKLSYLEELPNYEKMIELSEGQKSG